MRTTPHIKNVKARINLKKNKLKLFFIFLQSQKFYQGKQTPHTSNQVSREFRYLTCVKKHFLCKFREIDESSRRLEIQKVKSIFNTDYFSKQIIILYIFVNKTVCTGKIFRTVFLQLLLKRNKIVLNFLDLLLFFAFCNIILWWSFFS